MPLSVSGSLPPSLLSLPVTCSVSVNHSLGDQQWLTGQVQRLWNCPVFFTIQLDHSYQGIIEMFMYTGKGNALPTLRPSEFAYIAFIAEAAVSLSGHCESTKWVFFWPFCQKSLHCTICSPSWWWSILFTSLGLVLQLQGPNRSNVLLTSWEVSPSYLSYFGFNFTVEYSRTCYWITEGEVHRERKNLYLSWDSCLIVPNSEVWLFTETLFSSFGTWGNQKCRISVANVEWLISFFLPENCPGQNENSRNSYFLCGWWENCNRNQFLLIKLNYHLF